MAKIISNGQELVLPSGGVADVTVDSTLTKSDDGTIGVTTPVKAILTREAFEALPETERNTGMYVVYDEEDESSTPSTPDESSSAGEVYSEEETRIGTWIDGKPLYAKTYALTTPPSTSTSTSTVLMTLDETIEPKNFKGFIDIYENGETALPINFFYNSMNIQIVTSIQNHKLYQLVTNAQHTSKPCYITIEYTKTTD